MLLQAYIELLDTNPPAIYDGLGDWMALEVKSLRMTGSGM